MDICSARERAAPLAVDILGMAYAKWVTEESAGYANVSRERFSHGNRHSYQVYDSRNMARAALPPGPNLGTDVIGRLECRAACRLRGQS